MEFAQLRLFVSVAESKSYTKAAKNNFVSHSSTSRAVSALEDELGVRLLERESNRVMGLTKAGELLLERAKALIEEADSLPSELRALEKNCAEDEP